MTTTASATDPYVLPLPTSTTAVVPVRFLVEAHAHLNATYGCETWPLAPLTANPSTVSTTVHWKTCPSPFREELRLAAWTMINGQLRPTFLRERGNQIRGRVSAALTTGTIHHWIHLARWLEAREITTLTHCDTAVLHEYGQHLLDSGKSRNVVQRSLGAITRLWAFDQMSARPAGIARPPWDEHGVDDYLPPATSYSGENRTEPLAADTMGPLLVWAIRMVVDFSDDILAAHATNQRLRQIVRATTATPAGLASLHAFLDPLIAAWAPIPATQSQGKLSMARAYLSAVTGASDMQVGWLFRNKAYKAALAERPGPCPLDLPVTGRLEGRPWREYIDYYETADLLRHLGTACFIVISYLTGMRPQETLGLRAGCCPDPDPDQQGTIGPHLIRGKQFKTAVDEHGNHQSAGTDRDVPWVAIPPVVEAIRVLERIVPANQLLFDGRIHDRYHRPGSGSLRSGALGHRIEDFVAWANKEAAAHGLDNDMIPPDPHGPIGTKRFRRSLAWHIARRPGGLVALAIQYGHLRTALVSEGYAARSRGGIHELIDMETVRAVSDTVGDLYDALEAGEGVSGPAARHAIKAATHAPRFAGAAITVTTARRLLANEDAMLFDNPQAFLLCHYKRAQALCHRDEKDTPTLDHCVPGCGNVVRTDRHATQLRNHANDLEARAALLPQPVAQRLLATANKLRNFADTHQRTRLTLQENPA
ncbi:integrase [Streptomyces celluloflavus]|uniref:integrase n=1 Tax=Streptomyces celluloflavus TaxID=58344 RepID=UPI00346109F4|nr:integrase [Streptomyces celluloflavus]